MVVDAGPAFGTGGHATTRQCLEEMQEMTPGSLLDLGCGSGVVSFAALRLGFAPVWGIDIDPVAVEAAAGNAARNGLAPTFVGRATPPTRRCACRRPTRSSRTSPCSPSCAWRARLRRRGGRRRRPSCGRRTFCSPGCCVEQGGEAAAAFPEYEVAGRLEEDTWLLLHLTQAA